MLTLKEILFVTGLFSFVISVIMGIYWLVIGDMPQNMPYFITAFIVSYMIDELIDGTIRLIKGV